MLVANGKPGQKRSRYEEDDQPPPPVEKQQRKDDSSDSEHDHDHDQDHPIIDEEEEEDEEEEDNDEHERPSLSKNKIQVLEPTDRNNLFQLLHGDSEDGEEFDGRLSAYTKDEWAIMAENLFRVNIDSTCSNRELMLTLTLFHQLFCFPYKDEYAVVDRVKALYPDATTMKEQFKKIQRIFGLIHFELLKRNLIDEDSRAGREIHRMLTMIAFGMKISFEQMVHNRLLQKGSDKSMKTMLEVMSPMSIFQEMDTTKLKKHQQLLHFYYSEAFKNSYRKDGDSLYRPRYNKLGEFVYSYEYVFDVSDFVFQSIYPLEQNHYWFECLTEKNNNAKTCIDILTKVKSEWLPDLERNSDIHAFQNGLYILSLDAFFYFKKSPGKNWAGDLSGNIVAIKYHDMMFDEDGMERDMNEHAIRSYMSIKMEPIYQVLRTQLFSMEECQWIFCLLGRMLHPLGKMDTWAVFPYFLGLAGTGKSTALRLLASLLEARDVGYLNNTLQKTFALEGICDKLIYLALDIDEGFGLDQATFQSMVCGEEVSVLRKYKKPTTVLWNSHGGFAGNKLPSWTDNGGSLSRRLIVIEFLTPVSKCDPALFEKCLNVKDRFLKVINSSYHDMTMKFKNRGIKEVIPQKFRDSEQKALLELNILVAFIKDSCELDPAHNNQTFITTMRDFTKAFKMFCKRTSVQVQTLKYNFCASVFSKYQIKVITPESNKKDQRGQTVQYLLGVKLKENSLEDEK